MPRGEIVVGAVEVSRSISCTRNVVVVSKKCLCSSFDGECFNVDGMCTQERVLMGRAVRKYSGVLKPSVPMFAKLETQNVYIEILPVIEE